MGPLIHFRRVNNHSAIQGFGSLSCAEIRRPFCSDVKAPATADINQYDISDPAAPKHTGRIFLGGSIQMGSGVTVTEGEFKDAQPVVQPVKGVKIQGGPQMIQLR